MHFQFFAASRKSSAPAAQLTAGTHFVNKKLKSEIVTIYTQKVYLEIFASKILNRYNKLDAEIFNITISAIPKCD